MHVIVTAGHVDHGKTSLVDALTGMRSDRLPEERRRSMSIELGYVWTDLPGVGQVAFVDVPGHERFIATSIAGFGPAAAALLVVAADDPWMPQAEEHLGALEALGYTNMVVAITRSDLCDPAAARNTVERRLHGTALADSPIVETSARMGVGLNRLRSALAEMVQRMPSRSRQHPVRLWVDRRFTIKGSGTVVTGTLSAGEISRDDLLDSGDATVRVRGLHALGHDHQTVAGPARVAVNVSGKAPESLRRGSALVTPQAWFGSRVFDGRLVDAEPRLPRTATLHIGTAAHVVNLRALSDRIVRVQIPVDVPLHVGDVAILRDSGRRRMWRMTVLDPAPPRLDRRGAARQRAAILESAPDFPALASELARRGVVEVGMLRRLGVPDHPLPPGTIRLGEHLLDASHARHLRVELIEELEHERRRGNGGLTPAVAAQRVGLPNAELATALADRHLILADGLLRHVTDGLESQVRRLVERASETVAGNWLKPLTGEQLENLGLDHFYLGVAITTGHLVRCPGGTVLLPEAIPEALGALECLEQPFTAGRARESFGMSRRHALDLLAHLENHGSIRRLPDDTRVLVERQT